MSWPSWEWFFRYRGMLFQVWLLPRCWRWFVYQRDDVTAVAIGPVQVRRYAKRAPEAPAS